MTKQQKKPADINEYWQQREKIAAQLAIQNEDEYSEKARKILQREIREINKEIASFYQKYAMREGITLADAKKRASQVDLKEYGRLAQEYVQTKNLSKEANEQMALYNLTMKTNRLKYLKACINLQLVKHTEELHDTIKEGMIRQSIEEYQRQAGILGMDLPNLQNNVQQLIDGSFHGAHWSARIWTHQKKLRERLFRILQTGLIQGMNPRDYTEKIERAFGVTEYEANRLLRTEFARVRVGAQLDSIKQAGADEVVFIDAGPDTCVHCQHLNGQHFLISKLEVGVNQPPIHPNCRCSLGIYLEDSDEEYEKYLQDPTADNLTFEQWKLRPHEDIRELSDKELFDTRKPLERSIPQGELLSRLYYYIEQAQARPQLENFFTPVQIEELAETKGLEGYFRNGHIYYTMRQNNPAFLQELLKKLMDALALELLPEDQVSLRIPQPFAPDKPAAIQDLTETDILNSDLDSLNVNQDELLSRLFSTSVTTADLQKYFTPAQWKYLSQNVMTARYFDNGSLNMTGLSEGKNTLLQAFMDALGLKRQKADEVAYKPKALDDLPVSGLTERQLLFYPESYKDIPQDQIINRIYHSPYILSYDITKYLTPAQIKKLEANPDTGTFIRGGKFDRQKFMSYGPYRGMQQIMKILNIPDIPGEYVNFNPANSRFFFPGEPNPDAVDEGAEVGTALNLLEKFPPPDHPAEVIAGVKKGRPMTFAEADTGNVNPNFGKHVSYQINCQTAVPVFVARMKGFNIEAGPNTPGSVSKMLSSAWSAVYTDPGTGKMVARRTPAVKSAAQVYKYLNTNVKPGQIWQIAFDWKGGGGHTIAVLRDTDGQLMFYDPQPFHSSAITKGKDDIMWYLSRVAIARKDTSYNPEMMRVDNLWLNQKIMDRIAVPK